MKLSGVASGSAGGVVSPSLRSGFRLTTEAGVPVSPANRAAQATIYLTPQLHNRIALFDGTNWIERSSAEVSLALAGLTSGKNYDVFAYWSGSAVTLELSAAWTTDTARADAIARQDGVYVKSGTTSRRLVGTFRASAAGTTEDSDSQRWLWNAENRHRRTLRAVDVTDNWTYTTAAFRSANANTTDGVGRVSFVRGLDEDAAQATVYSRLSNSLQAVNASAGVGVDSTTVNSAQTMHGLAPAADTGHALAMWVGVPGLGWHFLQNLEFSNATGTTTWYGDSASTFWQSGMTGTVWA